MIDADRVTAPELAEALEDSIAILAFGALEQHGPHLPTGTDTLTADMVARVLALRLDVTLLPQFSYGATWNNAGYPGTLSLGAATVEAIAVDLARALAANRAELVIVNGDWGNRAPLTAATERLAAEGIRMLVLDYPGMEEAADRVLETPPAAPGHSLRHAEELETSIMLSLCPELVHRDREVAEYPDFPPDFGTRPMQLHEFSKSGVFGDPRPATAEKGVEVVNAIIRASLKAVATWVLERPVSS